jgi:putative tricarboxylic transport membrane protein
MNIFLIPLFVMILRVPYTILMCFIVIFAAVGAFAVNNNLFDVWMMLGFGVLGYIMKKLRYPIVPLVLALVLGNLAENSLRQALTISGGSFFIFFTRPISVLFIIAGILAYLSPVIRWGFKSRRQVQIDTSDTSSSKT